MSLFNFNNFIPLPFSNIVSPLYSGGYSFMPNFFNSDNYINSFFMPKYSMPCLQFPSYSSINNTFTLFDWNNCSDSKKSVGTKSTVKSVSTGRIDNSYSSLSPSAAWNKALSDNRLEKLNGGSHYTVANTFYSKDKSTGYTDIPFARKGTSEILEKVGKDLNITLNVTSALATGGKGNPHIKGGAKSHHNADNPKLDLSIPPGMSSSGFAQKLKNTGYFSHILNEGNHIDVQIAENAYKQFESLA